ncbi:hypothetical protein BBBOND_0306680 [Babesia bigemina]|uniref:Uncharacterized protein n=1 Tax=Babesia bigemina TaxID=5866 RepID=A0A061DCK6_BABBI|nr:hypothetical protein BBBOND_0306680 [Babesia bigemina]CDR96764.1 hypothetical protein BBBOND_0306680 [Babesia bigemina]|eukprot:XP_012768950.1 hypothetical protein BBBOND_0306680 [Babesia bigemina]
MVYTSLTEAPHNLKEAIDWLLAVKGDDATTNLTGLGAAVHKFLANKPIGNAVVPALEKVKLITKEFVWKQRTRGLWYVDRMLKRLEEKLWKGREELVDALEYVRESDYQNIIWTEGTTAEAVIEKLGEVVDGTEMFLDDVKIPEQYESAYSSEATWDASCKEDPRACAMVFVGIAPMLYTGLRSLKDSAVAATWPSFLMNSPGLGDMLDSVGYKDQAIRTSLSGPEVTSALRAVDGQFLNIIYDLAGFWAFYGLKNPAMQPDKNRKYPIPGVDYRINMKPIKPPKKYVLRKAPSTYTATGSNNTYNPGVPTVLDMGDTIPL